MENIEKIFVIATFVSVLAFVAKTVFIVKTNQTQNGLVEIQFNALSGVCTNLIINSISMVMLAVFKLLIKDTWTMSNGTIAFQEVTIVLAFVISVITVVMSLNRKTVKFCKAITVLTRLVLILSAIASTYCIIVMV